MRSLPPRFAAWVLSAALVLPISQVQAEPDRADSATHKTDCGIVDQVDLARLSGSNVSDYPAPTQILRDAERLTHPRVRFAPQDDVEIVILRDDGGVARNPTGTLERAVRRNGRWRVAAVVRSKPRTVRDTGTPLLNRVVIPSEADARRLDRLLSDECLWRTPPILGEQIPLRDGQVALSFDGPTGVYSIKVGNRLWVGMQTSADVGPPAEIADILMRIAAAKYARPSLPPDIGPPAPPVDLRQ